MNRIWTVLLTVYCITGCASADQPAHPSRMGRFMGLVANCGCSDVSPVRMKAEFAMSLGGAYDDAQIRAMAGYVAFGADERWPNMTVICAEVCSQRCMVAAVVGPLGGRTSAPACPVTERDLHLTDGAVMDAPGSGKD